MLTDALPPVDETVLTDAAGRFDDLDAIREQVDRAQHTADALGQFLGTYRGYTRTVLRRRADAVVDAESARAKAARAARQADRADQEAGQAVTTASEAVEARRGERVAADDERRALERSDAYRAHQDLVDRQARVDALCVAASTAQAAADRARAAAARAADEVGTTERALAGSLGDAQAAADLAAGLAVAAGLDRNLLGPLPARRADGSLSDDALAAAGDRARGARVLAETRQRRAEEVRVLAVRSERAGADADAADRARRGVRGRRRQPAGCPRLRRGQRASRRSSSGQPTCGPGWQRAWPGAAVPIGPPCAPSSIGAATWPAGPGTSAGRSPRRSLR